MSSSPENGGALCFNHGCHVSFELTSIDEGTLSEADIELAQAIDIEAKDASLNYMYM